MTSVVGILHPGAMGAAVGAALRSSGVDVRWASEGRSTATRSRADVAGLRDVATVDALGGESDILLSICPPHAAADVAEAVAGTRFCGTYVDANAVSPATVDRIAAVVERVGATFVDGDLIGGPPQPGGPTRLYLSGGAAPSLADVLTGPGLESVALEGDLAAASRLKMSYAAWTKGSAAMLLAIRAAARQLGVEEALLAEWDRTQPGLRSRSEAAVGSVPKAWRFVGEMHEIAATFASVGLPDGFAEAAADIYRRLEAFEHADVTLDRTLVALVGAPEEDRRLANRVNWDERVGIHVRSDFYDVERWLREQPGPREWEVAALGDVSGLSVVHLQCHFGLDTLAWARAGATVTGVDFSPAAITAARELAEKAGLGDRATFVCADVENAADALGGQTFDVASVSLGALCWLPSVERWAEQVAMVVRPGGRLYIHDSHPLSWALADDRLTVEHTYFEEQRPFVSESPRTYTDSDAPIGNQRTYEWNHGLGEVVSALIDHGFAIELLEEHDWTVWRRFPWLEEQPDGRWVTPPGRPRAPLSFTIVARRHGGPRF
jgi:SAM-dependent methyltransferase/3-hydroxyisobutyrate dehydrogenase-like beta-hydroxyacid dehydrogenase